MDDPNGPRNLQGAKACQACCSGSDGLGYPARPPQSFDQGPWADTRAQSPRVCVSEVMLIVGRRREGLAFDRSGCRPVGLLEAG